MSTHVNESDFVMKTTVAYSPFAVAPLALPEFGAPTSETGTYRAGGGWPRVVVEKLLVDVLACAELTVSWASSVFA